MRVTNTSGNGFVFSVSALEREIVLEALKHFATSPNTDATANSIARDLFNLIASVHCERRSGL